MSTVAPGACPPFTCASASSLRLWACALYSCRDAQLAGVPSKDIAIGGHTKLDVHSKWDSVSGSTGLMGWAPALCSPPLCTCPPPPPVSNPRSRSFVHKREPVPPPPCHPGTGAEACLDPCPRRPCRARADPCAAGLRVGSKGAGQVGGCVGCAIVVPVVVRTP